MATIVCSNRIISTGPANPAIVQSYMLVNDMARNSPSEKPETIASARIVADQRIPGSNFGTMLDSKIAVNSRKRATKNSLANSCSFAKTTCGQLTCIFSKPLNTLLVYIPRLTAKLFPCIMFV